MWLNRHELNSPVLNQFCQQKKFPCIKTCQNRIAKYTSLGHTHPKRATGNGQAKRELCGGNLKQLAVYCAVFPKATTDEIRAYLFNLQPANNQPPPLLHSQIICAEQLLQLSRKVGSTTCSRAYLPINLTKREMYFTWGSLLELQTQQLQI